MLWRLEREDVGVRKVLEQVIVRRGEPPPADSRVRRKQSVKGITCPGELARGGEPSGQRRLIHPPPCVIDERPYAVAWRQPEAADLGEELQLEKADR